MWQSSGRQIIKQLAVAFFVMMISAICPGTREYLPRFLDTIREFSIKELIVILFIFNITNDIYHQFIYSCWEGKIFEKKDRARANQIIYVQIIYIMREVDEGQDSEEFYQELEEQELANFNRHLRGRRVARGGRGNTQIDVMYKEALMDSIFGRFQDASKKLKLMITLAPDSPEPYHLLGTMHQELGQFDKAAQYLFMSTYLSPPNLEKWLKVGQLSFERRMFSQAAYCFGRALKIANCDPNIMIRRAQAFQLAGQSKKAIITYRRLLNIASSPQYAKKYARLRFRRGEYAMCREIIEAQPGFLTNSNLINMACETYLKQHQYEKAAALLQSHLQARQNEMSEGEELPAQFLIIMLICSVTLNRPCYSYSSAQLLTAAKECYEDRFAQLYSQGVAHLTPANEQIAYQLVYFLLAYPQHQTIANYIVATDYLCRQKDMNTCLQVLDQALSKFAYAPELMAQQNYINKCFGIKKHTRPLIEEDIFYSDDESPLVPFDHDLPQKNDDNFFQTEDPNIIVKLLHNIRESQKILLQELKDNTQLLTNKSHDEIMESLSFLINLMPNGKEKQVEKEGLYFKKTSRKRGQGQVKINLIYSNLSLVLEYFEGLIQYMLHLLKEKYYKRMVQVGQKVSKVHVFKNQNKREEFAALKVRIYELSVIGCLAVKKYNAALFFMRYLSTKRSSDQLYLLTLHLLLRFCKKKTFLSSALSKKLDTLQGGHLARILSIQYMDTGCFDLAVNAFLKLGAKQGALGETSQLCLSVCLLQIASSRNTYNKLDFTNRSAICFANYERVKGGCHETIYNRGRWYSQVKLNHKAIPCYQKVLKSQCQSQLKQKAAFNLMCIYKECQQYQKCDELAREYFSAHQE